MHHDPGWLAGWLATLSVALVLISPDAGRFNAVLDLAIVALLFPVCVLVASQAVASRFEQALLILGSASYPIYVLHLPVGKIVALALQGIERDYAPLSGLLLAALLVLLSIWIEKKFDIPVRRWLSKKLLRRVEKIPAVVAPPLAK